MKNSWISQFWLKQKKKKLGKEEGKPGKEEGKPGKKEGNYYPINKNQGRKR